MEKDNLKEKLSKKMANQEGISILFAVIFLSVILSLGLGISIISTQQVKMLSDVGYSVIAFYAAENGIEQVLITTSTPLNIATTTLSNGAQYRVIVTASSSPGCSADNYCIQSTGGYQNTKRAIKIEY